MNTGLAARIAIAAAAGLVTNAGVPPTNADEMKEAIFRVLCTGPHAGNDLGNHHHLLQFHPAYDRDHKLNELFQNHDYLRRQQHWPDIVNYLQIITIGRSNQAVGPVDVPIYFNF